MSDYQHPQDVNLSGAHRALKYDGDGEPTMRVSIEAVEPNSGLPSAVFNEAGNTAGNVDAFGRQRVAQPFTMFEATNVGKKTDKFFEVLQGNAIITHDASKSKTMLTTPAAGDRADFKSKRKIAYQPGKSMLSMLTFRMDTPTDGVIQQVGLLNGTDGVTFQANGAGLTMALQSSTTATVITPQSEWNIDTMDGNGPSGIILDVTKTQIFFIDIEWLGVGSVRTGFVVNGQLVTTHIFHNANYRTDPYMLTANLPVHYCIDNVSAVGTYTMDFICCAVMSEGGFQASAAGVTDGTDALVGVGVGVDWVNLASIRLDTAYPNAIVVPAGIDLLNISNTNFEWGLFVDATFAAPLSFANSAYSDVVEIAKDATVLTGLGSRVDGGYLGGNTAPVSFGDGELTWDNQLGWNDTTTPQVLTLAIRSGAPSKTAAGLIKWYEV